jgi:hypothetical protein
MKLETTAPEYSKVLKRIQDSIPKEWLNKLVKKVPQAPTIKKAYERAITDPNVSDEIKRKAQMILDSGYLDKEIEVVDKKWETHINKFIDTEIAASVRRGELPKSKKYRNAGKKIKRIIKNKR